MRNRFGHSCHDLVTLQGTAIVSGHFDKKVRFWDSRQDSSSTEIQLQGRLTSLDLTQGMILERQKQISRVRF